MPVDRTYQTIEHHSLQTWWSTSIVELGRRRRTERRAYCRQHWRGPCSARLTPIVLLIWLVYKFITYFRIYWSYSQLLPKWLAAPLNRIDHRRARGKRTRTDLNYSPLEQPKRHRRSRMWSRWTSCWFCGVPSRHWGGVRRERAQERRTLWFPGKMQRARTANLENYCREILQDSLARRNWENKA